MTKGNDDIITFYQGDEKGHGVQAYHFRIATETRKIDGKDVMIPKKLGDGNFGMVFEAPSTTEGVGTFALKVLYEHRAGGTKDDKNSQISRVLDELRIGVELPKRLKAIAENSKLDEYDPDFPKEGERQSQWLVLPKAYTENFKNFVGRDVLDSQNVKFSGFAYIMEKFDNSLKDLMEQSIDGDSGGYGRLKRSTLAERECSSIPILEQMCRGLQILHAAGLRHQDIKPANIYLKNVGTDIVLRLGDLGFLKPHDPTLSGTGAASIETIGIGTKHYRSIEQIDFSDIAECDVKVDKENRAQATLVTKDPKFLKTIMRKGDLAYFAKSNSHKLMRIDDLEKDFTNSMVTIKVSHKVSVGTDEQTGNSEENPLVEDRKTQVAFFKNPSAKTDLFGLASILYDILTIGESPERFYELLRRFDVKECNIEDRILHLYETWEAGTLEDADISAIFSRVNRGNDRGQIVRKEVLAFLLKCMMSDASGSYYEICKFGDADLTAEEANLKDENKVDSQLCAVKAWSLLIKELKKVEKSINAMEYIQHEKNVLTTKKWTSKSSDAPENVGSDPSSSISGEHLQIGLSTVLSAYLKGKSPISCKQETEDSRYSPNEDTDNHQNAPMAYRWLMGGLMIKNMSDRIDRDLREFPGSMKSLSQEHVSVKGHLIAPWRTVVTNSEDQIVRSLRARDPLLTRIRPFASRFEPLWWRYGTRRIRLHPPSASTHSKSTTSESSIRYARFDFLDFAFATNSIEKNDFILPVDGATAIVFRVEGVEDNGDLKLRFCIDNNQKDQDHAKQRESAKSIENAYLIKNPNVVDYYAGMLSIYLYHFLISGGVGQKESITDFPSEVYTRIRHFPLRFKKDPSYGIKEVTTFEQLKNQTLKLLVWLSLGGFAFDNKMNTPLEDEAQRWSRAFGEIFHWYTALNKFAMGDGKIDNWNMLTMDPNSPSFKNDVGKKFEDVSISQKDWDEICTTYIINETDSEKKGGGCWTLKRFFHNLPLPSWRCNINLDR